MSAVQHWRRIGKGSGPVNTYRDRYRVERSRSRWIVRDLRSDELLYPKFATMAEARVYVEANADQLMSTR